MKNTCTHTHKEKHFSLMHPEKSIFNVLAKISYNIVLCNMICTIKMYLVEKIQGWIVPNIKLL
jgi:hypothetical protein